MLELFDKSPRLRKMYYFGVVCVFIIAPTLAYLIVLAK